MISKGERLAFRSESGHGDRVVVAMSQPRRIAGGEVIDVAWAADDDAASARLADGQIHPARRAGFTWTEPTINLRACTPAIVVALLMLGACSAPSSIASDAGGDSRELSCGGYVNAIGVHAFRCEWQAWQCETPPPPSSALDACRVRVVSLGDDPSCEAVRAIVEACR